MAGRQTCPNGVSRSSSRCSSSHARGPTSTIGACASMRSCTQIRARLAKCARMRAHAYAWSLGHGRRERRQQLVVWALNTARAVVGVDAHGRRRRQHIGRALAHLRATLDGTAGTVHAHAAGAAARTMSKKEPESCGERSLPTGKVTSCSAGRCAMLGSLRDAWAHTRAHAARAHSNRHARGWHGPAAAQTYRADPRRDRPSTAEQDKPAISKPKPASRCWHASRCMLQ